MTTHKNTPEQQYRHAPLNGLTTGAIVGAVWVLVFLGVYREDTRRFHVHKRGLDVFRVSHNRMAHWLMGEKCLRIQDSNETDTQNCDHRGRHDHHHRAYHGNRLLCYP